MSVDSVCLLRVGTRGAQFRVEGVSALWRGVLWFRTGLLCHGVGLLRQRGEYVGCSCVGGFDQSHNPRPNGWGQAGPGSNDSVKTRIRRGLSLWVADEYVDWVLPDLMPPVYKECKLLDDLAVCSSLPLPTSAFCTDAHSGASDGATSHPVNTSDDLSGSSFWLAAVCCASFGAVSRALSVWGEWTERVLGCAGYALPNHERVRRAAWWHSRDPFL